MKWGKVPQAAVMDERVSGRDLRVFVYVCTIADGRTGVCRLRQETIAAAIKTDRKGVNRSLSHLADLGYLVASRPKGMRRSLEYRVLYDEQAAGQMFLFEADDAPRAGKSRRGSEAPSERGRGAPSCRGREAPSDGGVEAPSKEQTFQNRIEPTGSAQPRAMPSNDSFARDERKSVPEAIEGAIVIARPEIAGLSEALRKAAGGSINSAHPGFLVLTEPLGWLAAGCDLHSDVIPTIAGVAARGGRPAQSWRYFASAVLEARDRRLAASAAQCRPSDASPQAKGRFTDIAERRRSGGSGRFSEAFARRRDQFDDPDGGERQSWDTLELKANER